jgi:DNA replication regulator DPB11
MVRSAIDQASGIWMSDQDVEDVNYIIVKLVRLVARQRSMAGLADYKHLVYSTGSKLYREELDEVERTKYRTECWLERCLHEERVCPHQDHVTFLPLGIQLPVPGLYLSLRRRCV